MDPVALYLAERPEDRADPSKLAEEIAGLLAEVREAWPGVDVDEARFVAALGTIPEGVALESSRARELALALACDANDRVALGLFDAMFLDIIPPALARMNLDRATIDEVRQEVARKLLVSESGAAKIVDYAGRGSMAGLVRVTAVRTALGLLRKNKREVPLESSFEVSGQDLELGYLEVGYRDVFKTSFEDAVSQLDTRERNLLRLHFLGKVTLERLATMYGVHRATIVRQLASIRQTLEKTTRKRMSARLQLGDTELDSVMDLIRSRLDVSVERILRSTEL